VSEHILLSSANGVAEITLNRPDKLNAMTAEMSMALQSACKQADADPNVRVVIICGAGERAFSAGSDINALSDYGGPYEFRNRTDYVTQIRDLRKPCIAAVHGYVMGGGLEMALAADIRIAATSAQFGAPEVGLGWVGGGGASQMLPRLMGYGHAMYMLLQGDPIDAEKAMEWGMVEEVVPDGQALTRAREIAARIAEHSAVATETVKAAARQALSTSLEAGLRYENEVMSLSFALGNDGEGRDRFKKRE